MAGLAEEDANARVTDDSAWVSATRYDLSSGNVTERTKTPSGGLVARARVTRTGVLTYQNPDGSVRREYRPPEEVFHPDSLASLAGATLTDDHPGKVHPGNWRKVTIGKLAGEPKRDGKFVAAELHLEHDDAIDKAETGDLSECSCGYDCKLDPTPGVTPDGEKYDAIQRRIRYNHVALGPPGWGRAGPEVRMRMDSGAAVSGITEDSDSYVRVSMAMTPEEQAALDAAKKQASEAQSALTTFQTETKTRLDALEKANGTLKAENDVYKSREEQFNSDAKKRLDETNAAKESARIDSLVQEQVTLRADAARYLSTDDKPWKFSGQKPEELRRAIVKELEPDYAADAKRLDSLTGDALIAVYNLAVSRADRVGDAWDDVHATIAGARNDARGKPDDDEEEPEEGGEAKDDSSAEYKKMCDRKKDGAKNRRDREKRAADMRGTR